jgi:DNA-binding SARP family transcriptional activator
MGGPVTGPSVEIRLLGGFTVVVDGVEIDATEWRRRQAAALIKVLALTPGRSMHRERLIDTLWPDLDLDSASPRLHKAAHFARRSLGDPQSLVLGGDTVQLLPEASVEVDALVFQTAAERAMTSGDADAAGVAADQYRGDLLPDDPYEPWAEEPRERLRLLHLDVLRMAARWRDLAAADPTDEETHLRLARSLADRGDIHAAIRQLERLESALHHELGVAPGGAVIALRDELLQAAESRAASSPPVRAPGLVGRTAECGQLTSLMLAGGERSGGVAFVSGPSGVGKTTVLRWLEDQALDAGIRVGVGVAARVEGEWPYAPVLEAVSDLCRRHPHLLAELSPALRTEIDDALSGRTTTWDGQGAHQRLFVAVAELFRLASADAGVLLMIDHAHESDEASVTLLHYLARTTVDTRAFIVLGHRPVATGSLADLRGGQIARGRATVLELGPLGRDDAFAVAREVAPDADDAVLDTIFQKSGGLPFGIVELARAWSVDPSMSTPMVWIPPGLSETASQALRRASVLGMSFDTDELAALCELTDEDTYTVLDEALVHRVLRRTSGGYTFRHSQIRDSFLAALDDRDMTEAHCQAARALQQLGRSPARIGHHLVKGGDAPAAVPWLLQAAETEAAHGAYRDALGTLDRIAPAVEGADRSRLLSLRADLLSACGDLGAVDAYRAALAEAEADDRPRLLTRLARAATSAGDLDTAELALAEVDLDGSDNDPDLLLARGNLAFIQQDYTAADDAAALARERIGLGGDRWQLFDLIALQGLLAHRRGEWFQRLRAELKNTMQSPGLAIGIFDSHLCVAEYLLYGPTPYDEVLALAEQLRVSAQQAGVLRAVAFATALRGEAALLKGDLDLAERELLDAVDLHHDLESAAGEAHSLQRLAEVHLARGDRSTADGILQRALPLARWSSIGLHLLQRIYGTMIRAAPDAESALAVVDRAESTLANEDECHFCTIMLDVPAAQACAEVGDLELAAEYLASAEVSATLWEGTSWQAGILEAKAHIARAQDRAQDARQLLDEAATLFELSGQPLDAERCRGAAVTPASAAH